MINAKRAKIITDRHNSKNVKWSTIYNYEQLNEAILRSAEQGGSGFHFLMPKSLFRKETFFKNGYYVSIALESDENGNWSFYGENKGNVPNQRVKELGLECVMFRNYYFIWIDWVQTNN